MSIINLLSNNGYIIVNKHLIKTIGLHEAIILGEMCSEYTYWSSVNRLEYGFFYSTRENIEKNTGLSPYQQRQAFKTLVDIGAIITKERGMPQKIWYSLNEEKIYELLSETGLKSSSKKTSYQAVNEWSQII